MNKDLTQGPPRQILWRFCLPLFGSILFQQLYNIADSLVAGKFIGENALAAVGNSYEVTLIFLAFAFGCNIGCSVIVSRFFGAKKYIEMKTAIYTTLISGAVLCAVLMAFGFTLGGFLLTRIHTPTEIFDDSLLYLNIYILGLPFLFFYNVATGIFSALGNGISNYTSQNLGAGKLSRIRKGFLAGVNLVWLLCVPLAAAYFFFGPGLMRLFMNNPTQTAIETGARFLKILSPFYFIVSVKLAADGVLRGAGQMEKFMAATFTDLILRVILATLFSTITGSPTGIWCAWPVGWTTATLLSLTFYRTGPWCKKDSNS